MSFRWSFATSPAPSAFGPLLFAGRLGDAVGTAAELGFDGIEISLRDTGEVDPAGLGEELERRGLRLSALGTGRMFLEDGLCLSHPDADVRRRAVRRMGEVAGLASDFGALVIVGLVRGERPRDGRPGAEERARITGCLKECADAAAERGVSLAVEAINRYETVYQNTAEQAVELVEAVDRPNLGVLLDVFHMNIEEVSLAAAIRTAGPLLSYVHVVDSNRRAPGWGHVDFGPILAALDDIGYAGWLSAEVLPVPGDDAAARQVRRFAGSLEGS